ncbi:MAG: carbon-nitrogen hydrolase family protein [Xanthomonadales bacterium]|nr:carbon-nitrogen hydrolase family protein [Xanthomonadales bacterium]
MSIIGIAGLQLEAANGDNLESMEAEIAAVARRFPWVDMVLLGELNGYGTDPKHAQPMPGAFEERFSALARRHGIWLVPGSIMEKAGEACYNTAPVIDPHGRVIARYRKQFPWRPYEKGVSPGSEFVVFDVPGIGRFGVSICYDMWFPETLRTLAWMGAEVILHPSLTGTIDREAEQCIVRASAAMYQCYFVDVNLAGPLGVGGTIVAGPGGEVIHQAGRGREIVAVRLDLEQVREARKNGWHGLGQPLKSFRDSELRFPPYAKGHDSDYLRSLGPLNLAKSARKQDDGE